MTTPTTTPTTTRPVATTATTTATTSGPATRTRALLLCAGAGAVSWTVVSLAQAATRSDFDLAVMPLSALSTGELGWLQIANFVVGGILTVLGAVGLRRALPDTRWLPRLVAVDGLARIAAGLLVMDPVVPGVVPTTMSWHAVGHMAAGTISFATLTAACILLGRRYARSGRTGGAVGSFGAGAAVVAGNVWAMSGAPLGTVAIAAGVITGMLWLGAVAAGLARR